MLEVTELSHLLFSLRQLCWRAEARLPPVAVWLVAQIALIKGVFLISGVDPLSKQGINGALFM